MISEAASLLGIGKSTYDLAKALRNEQIDAKSSEEIAKLANLVMDDYLKIKDLIIHCKDLQNQVDALEAVLKRKEGWEEIKEGYELKALAPGALVFAPKAGTLTEGKPNHFLCPNCWTQEKVSYLQFAEKDYVCTYYVCPNDACGCMVKDTSDHHIDEPFEYPRING